MADSIPLPVITNGFRLANNYHSNDATFTNVFWVVADGVTTTDDVAQAWFAAYDIGASFAGPLALHSANVTMDNVQVTPLDGVSPTDTIPRATATPGLAGTPMAAANAALVVTWETGFRGIRNRGRSFFAGLPNASLETGAGRWSSALITDANDAFSNFLDNLANGDPSLQLTVVSQRSEFAPSHNAITSFIVRQGVGTQRRRTERNKP